MPIPGTTPCTVRDLKRGDVAALFNTSPMQNIRRVTPIGEWGVRVEWDNGPGSRAYVRTMPASNPVQVA